jgi:putative transposase
MSTHRAFELYAHITWHTWRRVGCVDQEVARDVRAAASEAARRTASEIRAFATLSDHVHVVLSFRPSTRLSDFVRLAKAGSSYQSGKGVFGALKWARGFFARSVGKEELPIVIAYVRNQYGRHPDRLPKPRIR